jgi:hypothetical protein
VVNLSAPSKQEFTSILGPEFEAEPQLIRPGNTC